MHPDATMNGWQDASIQVLTGSVHPGVTLDGWQDASIQNLTGSVRGPCAVDRMLVYKS